MPTSLEVLKKCFSNALFRQYQRRDEIFSLFKATQPALEIFAHDYWNAKSDDNGIKLLSFGNMTDFPAESKYSSIRLPNERTLINDWMTDAKTLVFTDMYLSGLVTDKIIHKYLDRKMLFICYQGGPIQQEEERIIATKKLFQLVDIIAPSLKRVLVIGEASDDRKTNETESLLKKGLLLLPERLLNLSQLYIAVRTNDKKNSIKLKKIKV